MDELSCLFKNEHIYVIHKPYNVPFHSLDETQKHTQDRVHVEGIISLAKKFLSDDVIYPVHRLDRMTSGLMIFARSKQANSELSALFQNKSIEKYYLALSSQKPKKKQGSIIGDMSKSRSGSYLLKRSKNNPAITRFFSGKLSIGADGYWAYLLKPETGKTHQLRVALKSLGSPITGDERYSGAPASRGYLHAYRIRFKLFGKHYDIQDPFFLGEEFSLRDTQTDLNKRLSLSEDSNLPESNQLFNSEQLSRLEKLPWPKPSFLLD